VKLRLAALLAVAWLAGLLACMGGPRPVTAPVPVPVPGSVTHTVLLIGDAGAPAPGEPVLAALEQAASGAPSRTTVVFLGDNIYPAGLPAEGHHGRAEAERRLDDQVDAVRDTGARVIFVPGNHDWDNGGPDGWEAVKRQQKRIAQRGGPNVALLPPGGCPGPEVVDVGERLRIVALDTQWWLHEHDRPAGRASGCATGSVAEVIASLRDALRVQGREVVLVTHHPPASGGPHGGNFGLKQHLFPFTETIPWLWLPVPVIGSAYPLVRQAGVVSQDIGSAPYSKMRDAIASTLRERPPLAWAAGHEHVLQVIESTRYGRVLVSGTGVYNHVSRVANVDGSRYRSSRSGYMRIDLFADGRRRLGVIEVDHAGREHVAYSSDLDEPRLPPPARP
jgi:Calcineurin-like phosphoesterase